NDTLAALGKAFQAAGMTLASAPIVPGLGVKGETRNQPRTAKNNRKKREKFTIKESANPKESNEKKDFSERPGGRLLRQGGEADDGRSRLAALHQQIMQVAESGDLNEWQTALQLDPEDFLQLTEEIAKSTIKPGDIVLRQETYPYQLYIITAISETGDVTLWNPVTEEESVIQSKESSPQQSKENWFYKNHRRLIKGSVCLPEIQGEQPPQDNAAVVEGDDSDQDGIVTRRALLRHFRNAEAVEEKISDTTVRVIEENETIGISYGWSGVHGEEYGCALFVTYKPGGEVIQKVEEVWHGTKRVLFDAQVTPDREVKTIEVKSAPEITFNVEVVGKVSGLPVVDEADNSEKAPVGLGPGAPSAGDRFKSIFYGEIVFELAVTIGYADQEQIWDKKDALEERRSKLEETMNRIYPGGAPAFREAYRGYLRDVLFYTIYEKSAGRMKPEEYDAALQNYRKQCLLIFKAGEGDDIFTAARSEAQGLEDTYAFEGILAEIMGYSSFAWMESKADETFDDAYRAIQEKIVQFPGGVKTFRYFYMKYLEAICFDMINNTADRTFAEENPSFKTILLQTQLVFGRESGRGAVQKAIEGARGVYKELFKEDTAIAQMPHEMRTVGDLLAYKDQEKEKRRKKTDRHDGVRVVISGGALIEEMGEGTEADVIIEPGETLQAVIDRTSGGKAGFLKKLDHILVNDRRLTDPELKMAGRRALVDSDDVTFVAKPDAIVQHVAEKAGMGGAEKPVEILHNYRPTNPLEDTGIPGLGVVSDGKHKGAIAYDTAFEPIIQDIYRNNCELDVLFEDGTRRAVNVAELHMYKAASHELRVPLSDKEVDGRRRMGAGHRVAGNTAGEVILDESEKAKQYALLRRYSLPADAEELWYIMSYCWGKGDAEKNALMCPRQRNTDLLYIIEHNINEGAWGAEAARRFPRFFKYYHEGEWKCVDDFDELPDNLESLERMLDEEYYEKARDLALEINTLYFTGRRGCKPVWETKQYWQSLTDTQPDSDDVLRQGGKEQKDSLSNLMKNGAFKMHEGDVIPTVDLENDPPQIGILSEFLKDAMRKKQDILVKPHLYRRINLHDEETGLHFRVSFVEGDRLQYRKGVNKKEIAPLGRLSETTHAHPEKCIVFCKIVNSPESLEKEGICEVFFSGDPLVQLINLNVYLGLSVTETGEEWHHMVLAARNPHPQIPTKESLRALFRYMRYAGPEWEVMLNVAGLSKPHLHYQIFLVEDNPERRIRDIVPTERSQTTEEHPFWKSLDDGAFELVEEEKDIKGVQQFRVTNWLEDTCLYNATNIDQLAEMVSALSDEYDKKQEEFTFIARTRADGAIQLAFSKNMTHYRSQRYRERFVNIFPPWYDLSEDITIYNEGAAYAGGNFVLEVPKGTIDEVAEYIEAHRPEIIQQIKDKIIGQPGVGMLAVAEKRIIDDEGIESLSKVEQKSETSLQLQKSIIKKPTPQSVHILPNLTVWVPLSKSQLENVVCPICGFQNRQLLAYSPINGVNLPISQCLEDGMIYTSQRPNVQWWEAIYSNALYFGNHLDGQFGIQKYGDNLEDMRTEGARIRLDLIEEWCPQKGLLVEGGVGEGHVLLEAQKRGWKVLGVEVGESSVRKLRTQHDLEIIESMWEDAELPEGVADAVGLFSMLEHSLDPNRALQQAHSVLKRGGLLFIRSPDITGYAWDNLDTFIGQAREHIWQFSDRSLKLLLEKNSFELVQVVPAGLGKTHDGRYSNVNSIFIARAVEPESLLNSFDKSEATNLYTSAASLASPLMLAQSLARQIMGDGFDAGW
ncbi:MAG: class I SAM-dependent methyltransferase, partial [Candidatus Omnitrophica bacterium]|nr:class I SAM-dependent methyltransferase [Candidatus Omnitrophota bacterium]